MQAETPVVTPRWLAARRTSLQTSGIRMQPERQAKLRSASALNQVVEQRKLSQPEAGIILSRGRLSAYAALRNQ